MVLSSSQYTTNLDSNLQIESLHSWQTNCAQKGQGEQAFFCYGHAWVLIRTWLSTIKWLHVWLGAKLDKYLLIHLTDAVLPLFIRCYRIYNTFIFNFMEHNCYTVECFISFSLPGKIYKLQHVDRIWTGCTFNGPYLQTDYTSLLPSSQFNDAITVN